jgi:hypothetical protein
VADDGIVLQIPPVEGDLPGAGLITFERLSFIEGQVRQV